MFPRLLLVFAFSFVCAGCSILDFLGIASNETSTLSLRVVGMNNTDGFNALDSYQGLAGLRVEITGAVERVFTAEDFPVEAFPVPSHGLVFAEATVRTENGYAVARVSGSWSLEPGYVWGLRFNRRREPDPPSDDPRTGCSIYKEIEALRCWGYWYSNKIEARHRNQEDEVLRMVLSRARPCPPETIVAC